ncbi:hypothetical protein [Streptomyces sp. NPDC002221]|uniref:hypothetical protein n=1 Tax=Streptomyces sp. NPDC002221 TaxID=3364639 RepID=UPI0036972168
MTDTSPAAELTAAAFQLRNPFHGSGLNVGIDPDLAVPLARLLDCVAVELTDAGGFAAGAVDGPLSDRDHNNWSAALAVARQILGTQP